MKVKIGAYKNWTGPYQIAEKILFWMNKDSDKVHNFGRWLSKDAKGNDSYISRFCDWVDSKRKRQVFVQIDDYDVWNMNDTLCFIIHPMLIKLKENQQTFALVDNSDLPSELRTIKPNEEFDEHLMTRKWDWVLDEMIWAFDPDWYTIHRDFNDSFEKREANEKRRYAAFRLFGKYYNNLWS